MGKVLAFPGKPVTTPATHKRVVGVASDFEALLPRDQYDRPLILRLDHEPHRGECRTKGVDKCYESYRRASTVAEALDSHYGLDVWKRRLTAQGLAMRPDLYHSLHAAKTRQEVDAICEEAFLAAGGDAQARNGSTLHGLTNLLDRGENVPPGLPSNIVAMLEAYEKTMARFEFLDGERFVVQDRISVAGTYDSRRRDKRSDRIYVCDLKTGQDMSYLAIKLPAQVAVYASGQHYDLDGERTDHGADHDRGLLIHVPWVEKPEDAEANLKWLDLRVGRSAIKEAFRIDRMRKITDKQTMLPVRG